MRVELLKKAGVGLVVAGGLSVFAGFLGVGYAGAAPGVLAATQAAGPTGDCRPEPVGLTPLGGTHERRALGRYDQSVRRRVP